MTLLFDKGQSIASPALAPAQDASEHADQSELTIVLINNMPDSALKATERQFMRLLEAAAGKRRVQFHCFSLPSVARSQAARSHIDREYGDIADLGGMRIDGLIVTGAEPVARDLPEERYWHELLGEDKYAVDDLVLSGSACRGAGAGWDRATAARAEMLRRLRLRQGHR